MSHRGHPCSDCGGAVKRAGAERCRLCADRAKIGQTHDASRISAMFEARFGHSTREDRFWSLLDRSEWMGCWVWTGSRNRLGYGVVSWGDRGHQFAHRIAWELSGFEIPDGQELMHHCDNPPCVNPSHLSAATHAENMADMAAKGRAVGWPRTTHCIRGHLREGNMNRHRQCRPCNALRARECAAARSAA